MSRTILVAIAFGSLACFAPPQSSRAADQAVVNGMIKRGVGFLRAKLGKEAGADGASVLATYAMVKGGVPPSDPLVQNVIKAIKKKIVDGKYKPRSEVIYTTGVELMLLEAAGGKGGKYRPEMQAIVDFVVKNQANAGYWNYLGGDKHGDTSVTQYGILGLWAAARVGIKIPPTAWDNAASWLRATQAKEGGWQYRPTSTTDTPGQTTSMTVAGVSTLLVTRLYLHPDRVANAKGKKKKKKVFSLNRHPLEKVDTSTPISKQRPGRKKKKKVVGAADYKARNSYNQISGSANGGLRWLAARYQTGSGRWAIYTLYGVERMAALSKIQTIGRVNWFDDGVRYLAKAEQSGSWNDQTGKIPATSFAVLFLTRSTAKTLGFKVESLGDGLLRGGKGLPADLSTLGEGEDGKIKKRKITGTIDQLLAELQKPQNRLDVGELQQAIVKKIQLGDRKQWLKPGKRKQLLSMAEHPKPEVRMVAIWALGRTGNIDIVTILMDALEKDPDLSVAIEARNALCWLSRRPRGFGLPSNPTADMPPTATKKQKLAAIEQWRKDAVKKWKNWYLTVRPYSERDDLKDTGDDD